MNIFITGGTGFIGKEITDSLLKEGHQIFLLVRPASLEKAKLLFGEHKNLKFIEGDITQTDVIHNISSINNTINKVDTVIHMAAVYDFKASYEECYYQNVIGTQNIINLIKKMPALKHFHYFSTFAVNPISEGSVSEDFLTEDPSQFPDSYSLTKNHAEHLVKKNVANHFTTIIYRPGIIVGDSQNGAFAKIDGPYLIFDLLNKIKKKVKININLPITFLPIDEKANLPILPVDILTNWASQIILNPPKENKTYHLISPQKIKAGQFLEQSFKLLGFKTRILAIPGHFIFQEIFKYLKLPSEIIFYSNLKNIFETTQLFKDYPELEYPLYQDYLPTLIRRFLKEDHERNR